MALFCGSNDVVIYAPVYILIYYHRIVISINIAVVRVKKKIDYIRQFLFYNHLLNRSDSFCINYILVINIK
jgi:hypothetical protein